MRIRTLATVLIVSALLLAGCDSWERRTFQTLSASDELISQASADYNAGVLPKTQRTYDILLRAQQVHNLCVQTFQTYWQAKTAIEQQQAQGAITGDQARAQIATARAIVDLTLRDLPLVLARIHDLRQPIQHSPGTVKETAVISTKGISDGYQDLDQRWHKARSRARHWRDNGRASARSGMGKSAGVVRKSC
jgi:uncharacterized protein YcfL